MSGRAYTMKELKGIVEYVKERKAYGETKGRKMWVHFANSGNTTRTWQSLKETYLKRILPDIHNPYYKLTPDELRSFRAGNNLIKSNHKLEVHSSDVPEVSDQADQEEKSLKTLLNYNGDIGNATGEKPNVKTTGVHRDSDETVILDSNEPCYSTSQEIIRDLESPMNKEPINYLSAAKSIRDVFTYSEPLTPMIQEIFHDFDSEESNTLDGKLSDNNKNNSTIHDSNTNDGQNMPSSKGVPGNKDDNESDKIIKVKSLQKRNKKLHKQKSAQNMRIENTLEEVKNLINENKSSNEIDVRTEKINVNSSSQNDKIQPENRDDSKEVIPSAVENSQSGHNTGFTDSSIPNNQEALNKNKYAKESETVELSSESNLSATAKNPIAKTKSKRNISKHSDEKTPSKRKRNSNVAFEVEVEGDKDENEIKSNDITIVEKEQVSRDKNKDVQTNGLQYVEPIVKIINNTTNAIDDVNGQNINNYVNEEESHNTKKTNAPIISEQEKKNIGNNSSQITNPCLQSASLYLGGKVKPNSTKNNRRFSLENNVVLLDSHSDSDTSNSPITSPQKRREESSKVLAKVFGFSNDAGNHKTETSVVTSTISDSNDYSGSITSDSSRWTSDDDIQFVASPRKSRHSRKYLNPGFCKIVPLDQEGGLVVAYKGRVYPLIKEERRVRGRELKYMFYAPNKNTEDKASYWRKKYFKEKKKAQELTSKLTDNKKSSKIIRKSTSVESKGSDQNVPQIPDHAVLHGTVQDNEKIIQRKEVRTDDNESKAIKVKIHSNNKEVAIEGQWQNMAPILTNIMQLFDNEPAVKTNNVSDDDVKEKISRIEEEIFREIEEIEKSSPGHTRKSVSSTRSLPDTMVLPDTMALLATTGPPEGDFGNNTKPEQILQTENITNRRKRGRAPKGNDEKIASDQIDQSAGRKRTSKELSRESEDEIIVNEDKLQLLEDIAVMNRKTTPKKYTNIGRKKSLRRKRLTIDSDDSTIGYKFPSPEREILTKPVKKMGQSRMLKKVKKT